MVQNLANQQVTRAQENWVNNLREFAQNLGDITDPNYQMSHEHQNKLAQDAKAGWSTATHTTIAQNDKRDRAALQAKAVSGARAMASTIQEPVTNNFNFNLNLSGVRLDDPHMVDIRDDNILMVRGEGPDSEFREASLSEKIQIETETGACSIALTQDEIDIANYLNGGETVPEHLQQLAEREGFSIEYTTRQEYENLFNEEYADQMHIIAGSQGALPLELNQGDLLPTRTGTSAVDSGLSADDLLNQFSLSASPALNIPSLGPVPAVTPPTPQAFTPS